MKSTTIFICLIAIFSSEDYTSIADEIVILKDVYTVKETLTPCDRNDLDLDQCLKNLIQDQIEKNINGSKILDIPPLDPWSLPRTKYLYRAQNMRMILTTENVKIHGLKRTSIVNVNTKFQKNDNLMSMEMMMHYPRVRMSGNYSANIRMNDLKMKPKGKFNMTLVNVINTMKLSGEIEDKNNHKFLRLKKFTLDPLIEDIRFNITGVFPFDQQLNTILVQFINSYWRNLYPLIIRETRPDWEPMLLNVTNQFLTNFPFETLIRNSKI